MRRPRVPPPLLSHTLRVPPWFAQGATHWVQSDGRGEYIVCDIRGVFFTLRGFKTPQEAFVRMMQLELTDTTALADSSAI